MGTGKRRVAPDRAREDARKPQETGPAGDDRRFVQPGTFLQLVEDVVRTDDRVLQVRPAFALEAQGLVDIEDDDLAARELDHEVADGGDADHAGDALAFGFAQLGIALADLAALADQPDELDGKPLLVLVLLGGVQ